MLLILKPSNELTLASCGCMDLTGMVFKDINYPNIGDRKYVLSITETKIMLSNDGFGSLGLRAASITDACRGWESSTFIV